VRELQALIAPNPLQGVLVRGYAGLVINKLSLSLQDEISSRSEEPLAEACLAGSREGLEASIAATGAAVERARFEIGQAGPPLNPKLSTPNKNN